ncbi:hypothetical protein GO986_17270 [Deinococcus sp. HMF7620]|uniref:Uncharacterized protein n=1 Tax=Deinococcus arboris TaxID=2682977 RepID=A0A7C9I1B1_9DEIO|nr:permease prefix domain 1-containing protein [Deinococcus arboris]MVN88495.1 hypothetical protein [Deinococcus arboris]
MTHTERYLRAATRGLWGKERRTLHTELKGHIEVRIQELRLAGLSEEDAEGQALRELGGAAEVRTGMFGVHTLPRLGKGGLLGLMAVTLLVSTLPHSQAQVSSIFSTPGRYAPAAYVDFAQLQLELQKAGGKLTGTAAQPMVTLPGTPHSPSPVHTGPGLLRQEGRTYIPASAIMAALANTGADVQLRGWLNPTIQAGQTVIRLQTADPQVSTSLYGSTLSGDWELQNGALLNVRPSTFANQTVTFRGNVQEGQVYALALPSLSRWYASYEHGPQDLSGSVILNVAINVAQKGEVTFRIQEDVRFFKLRASVGEMQLALDPYRDLAPDKLVAWSPQRPAPATLLELKGRFGPGSYSVVSPQDVQRR